ncbi:polyprenal reductase [Drosophila bipectinata]|uniref:polyprenal reductase n=1 Tax=Drosophila bipectinata TaxID=42026 RepID=UPI001C8AA1FC|nr:polyprenol reductase [Drosophila bipectinata]
MAHAKDGGGLGLDLETLIDRYKVNLLQLIFGTFIATIAFFGGLMTFVERYLPNSIRQAFRYGKHSFKGELDPFIAHLEVPKSWFRHFYIFAVFWSWLAFYIITSTIQSGKEAPEYVMRFLDFMAGGRSHRKVETDSTTALVGTIMLTLQCTRRFYETNFVQIFSKQSKINLSHYVVGYAHYFGTVIALMSNTAGFVRGSQPIEFTIDNLTGQQILYLIVFGLAWQQQYSSNMILVNLRTDPRTGRVKTEKHLVPKGGLFNVISSPHMSLEIVMYFCIADLFMPVRIWRLIFLWVASNQTINALLTHRWYQETFRDYPRNRRAIIPFLL